MSYYNDAKSDAKDTALNFLSQIVEFMLNDGEASDDLLNSYDGGDSYHHETLDKEYDLMESAEILDQLYRYEETDKGLWEGLDPRKAVACKAAFTYGNAVYFRWTDLIGEINASVDIREIEDKIRVGETLKIKVEEAVKAVIDGF